MNMGLHEQAYRDALRQGAIQVLLWALKNQASDVHWSPLTQGFQVLVRKQGRIHTVCEVPTEEGRRLIQTFKALAHMNIAEYRRPQDGRLDFDSGQARLATHPCLYGESLVVRLLPKHGLRDLTQLGLTAVGVAKLFELAAPEEGLTLVSGPMGSGKTTTLHALICSLADKAGLVATLEDPVEVVNPGIRQTDLSGLSHLSFAAGLRSLMRQDPDTLLVGEIRDRDTAELCLSAALTGHRVLASVHAPDCLGTLARLLELGVSLPSLMLALNGVANQRLIPGPNALQLKLETLSVRSLPRQRVLEVGGIAELYRLALAHDGLWNNTEESAHEHA